MNRKYYIVNKTLNTESLIRMCVGAMRAALDSANNIERAKAFWPLIVIPLLVSAIHGFDPAYNTFTIFALIPLVALMVLGWGKETRQWAEKVINSLPLTKLLPPLRLPDLLVKISTSISALPPFPPRFFSRTIPVSLAPPRPSIV